MKLTDFISRKAIIPQLKFKDKKGVTRELVQIIKDAYGLEKLQINEVVESILEREKVGSTGLGGGVALPHAKSEYIKTEVGAFGRSIGGIDFSAVDGEPVYLIFLILSPSNEPKSHLLALQMVVRAIQQPNFCRFLKNAKGSKEIEDIFKEVESFLKV